MRPIGGLSAASRQRLAKVLRQTQATVSARETAQALDLDIAKASRLLARWAAFGWLSRVRRGLYVPVPIESSTPDVALQDPWVVAERLFAPCYVGGWSAAEYWGFTEQIFRSTLVVTTRRPRMRKVDARGSVFVVRTVRPRAMFGLKPVWRGRVKVHVSDPTRTILDLLDTPSTGGGIRSVLGMLRAYMGSPQRDSKLLIRYADQLGNKAVFKRLGFIASTYFPQGTALIEACGTRLSAGNARLDPKLPSTRLATAWRLWIPEFGQGAVRAGAAEAKLGRWGTMTMNRTQIVRVLADRRQEIAARYGVKRLALFGSAARDELGVSSDVDVLVEFAGPATFGAYMDLKFYLEDLLGRPVDLVTDKALRNELRPYVEKEMIRVA
jgi:predicted transcriptional regulator of viral defense system/predicted nucleotidyltransferase